MDDLGKAYLDALTTFHATGEGMPELAHARAEIMLLLINAKIDVDVDIDGVQDTLDETWKIACLEENEFEQGGIDMMKVLLIRVEIDRALIAPLRSGNARNLLVHLDQTGEVSDAELFESDLTTEAELSALAKDDYVFGALAGPVRLYRITPKGREALKLANRLLPR